MSGFSRTFLPFPNRRNNRATAVGEKTWWLAKRDNIDVFAEDLEQALQIVASPPGAGTLYTQSPIPGVRRIYFWRVVAHLYYTLEDDDVIIRALWGARRERGPRI